MSTIKLKNILAENMRRFGTKNLNEGKINSWDEKPLTLLGKPVVVIDSVVTLTAHEALTSAAKETNTRLMTKDEMSAYLNKANYPTPDDRIPANEQQWRAFIQDPYNKENPMLWDLVTNQEAPRALPATRYLGIQISPDFETYK